MNGQETEVKFYVKDLGQIEERLRALRAQLTQPRVHETNLRFDLPDGGLRGAGRVLRLRMDTQARLTYKGPSERLDGVLSRAEYETSVGDFETAQRILRALGYVVTATYEKFRATYEWEGLHVMLDELPYGDFVEIEGPDADSLQTASRALGLDFSAAIPASYLALFEGLCQKRGLDPSRLTFEVVQKDSISAQDLCTPFIESVRPADERN
ncbi:MAG: class IV adenylate cyclase [Chloroflexota bacterium]